MKSLADRIQKLHFSPRNKVINLLFGQYHSVFKGRGLEFEDLREYMIGDSIKDIDWKSTAKTGNIHVKKYKETRELHILFALDISSSMQWRLQSYKPRMERALDFITLVSMLAISHGDTMGLMLYDAEVRSYVPFKRGNIQLIRILKEVDTHTKNNFWHDTNAKEAMKFLLNGIKKRTICFFITDSLDCVSHLATLRAMNTKHECVIVYLGDDIIAAQDIRVPLQVQDIETGETLLVDFQDVDIAEAYNHYLEDINHKKTQLKKSAIDMITLLPNDDIARVLYRFLHMQARRKNRSI